MHQSSALYVSYLFPRYDADISRARLRRSIKSMGMLGCGACSSPKALLTPFGQVVQHLHRNRTPLLFLAQAKHKCRTTYQCATSIKDAVVTSSCALEFIGTDGLVATSDLSFTPGQWMIPVTITAGLENLSNLAATQTTSASTSKAPPTGPSQTSNPTTSGSSPSNPTSTSSSGLSIGAKAGIGVSISVVALLILCLLLFFLLRHRRQGQTKQNTESTNDPEPVGPHELSTKANTHELLSKEKAGELNAAPGDQAVVQYLSGASEIRPQTPHEVDATPLYQGQKAELGGQGAVDIGGPVSPTPISRKAVNVPSSSNEDGASPETEEQREERLRVLEERIERIREDKERVAQLQRLTELEEETKREIMNVSRGES
jgi:hypothetical protein